MEGNPIHFGIIGCAEISRKVSRAMSLAPSATLSAIGSRSIDKAKRFAVENGLPEAVNVYGSYEEVLDDPTVEAVYVPLPTSMHVQWAVAVAERKKHVLLEKPTALNVADLDRILEACESNGVQFMDGTMWVHHPRTHKMKELLSDPNRFGELRSVHSDFAYCGDAQFLENDIRVKPDLDGLGALGDTGWYCIRSILWANDYELPKTVTALQGTYFNKAGVILSCGASMVWEDGKVATFHCGLRINLVMDVTVHGSNGTLHLNDFVIPFKETSAPFTFGTKNGWAELSLGWRPLPSEHVVETDLPQEAYMVEEFVRLVKSIKDSGSKPDSKWPTISRKTQLVIDAVKASIDKGCEPINVVS
ncbi:uncharacterized oxidoreductase At4g09670-like [Magnolia sinica]|uniref:uncharacterized oxidoreductase At4g09670-like n=1 Tax=Magnolia sinica TaxID=86752 RepID=UPI00265A66A4|nr:uncharacterized oxidoreductase At4g09670-like [Magnolia sinica]